MFGVSENRARRLEMHLRKGNTVQYGSMQVSAMQGPRFLQRNDEMSQVREADELLGTMLQVREFLIF